MAVSNSSGCGKPLATSMSLGGTGESNNITMMSSGIERAYLLHFPTDYSPTTAHGLIFSYAGRHRNATQQEALSEFSNPFFNPHMLAVYPEGINMEWQGDPNAHTDDVAFTLDMIESLSAQYCIDTDRIYAAGKSNGGGFVANVLACDPVASTQIAAFAAVSGAYYQEDTISSTDNKADACDATTVPFNCNPGRTAIPILETHGTSDETIPYDGGPRRDRCLPAVPHFLTKWSMRNGFGASNTSTSMHDGQVTKYEYDPVGHGTADAGVVTHYMVEGLGHQWPSTVPNDDGGATYFNATEVIMEFFQRWSLRKGKKDSRSVPLPTALSEGSDTTATLKSPHWGRRYHQRAWMKKRGV